ncbi:MAG: VCBS repeat-containing protein [Polaromonas sp.]|nr:VCBS repeat-containing protein [Polaromonas sp.]
MQLDDPNLRIIDLNGDGKADLLISEEQVMRWYPSLGDQGFGDAQFALQRGAGEVPEIIFSDESESIFTADMTGDGLSDIVRIRNGSVVYWPNLGHGKFGKKVTMAHAPRFNNPDLFTASQIRLADLDGSGTTDIIYLGKNEFQFWIETIVATAGVRNRKH